MAQDSISTDIEVLREMVRLAENRRLEELKMIERLNQYSLALIAFSGAFLSLLVSASFPDIIVEFSGFFLLLSIVLSLIAIRPRTLKGGTITIQDDVQMVKDGKKLPLNEYLLLTSDVLDQANLKMGPLRRRKSFVTTCAAVCLAIALCFTYSMYVYAAT